MNMITKARTSFLAVTLAAIGATTAHAATVNLITNGGFETVGPSGITGGLGAANDLPGWTVGPGGSFSSYIHVPTGVTGVEGSNLAILLSHTSGWTLSQNISVTTGINNTLTYLWGKGGDAFRNTQLKASVYLASNLSTAIATTGFRNAGNTDILNAISLNFTAIESDVVVRFEETSANRTFAWLDDVQVLSEVAAPSAVPLPAGLPLLLAGIGLFGLMKRRKKA